jgi:hypothetical protein
MSTTLPYWNANPNYANFDRKHPEIMPDEVFLCNTSHKSYQRFAWQTKRQGEVAYSIFGRIITDIKPGGFRPIFISREELKRRGMDIHMQPVNE